MPETPEDMERVARQLRAGYETGDVGLLAEILDPSVRWGAPGDPSPPCQSREQVIAWYERAKTSGVSAHVTEVEALGDRLLVGLVVRGGDAGRERGGLASRWQLFTVRGGKVVDIVGFEQRAEAESFAQGTMT